MRCFSLCNELTPANAHQTQQSQMSKRILFYALISVLAAQIFLMKGTWPLLLSGSDLGHL